MKRIFLFLFTIFLLCLAECTSAAEAGYTQIDQETAKEMIAMFDGFTDFYYTYDASTAPPYYQRYRFYMEDGEFLFYHETREGGGWPQTEEDITASGTLKLTEDDKKIFFSYLEGGTIKEPELNDESGDAGPWTYIYRGNGQEEYVFPSYGARLAFEEYCEGFKRQPFSEEPL